MSTKDFSNKQELRVAKLLGGKKVAASGAKHFNKGDVRVNDNILVECKTCLKPKDSFSIKKDWLIKNKEEAFSMGYSYNLLAFDFGDGEDYFVIDSNLAQLLIQVLKGDA